MIEKIIIKLTLLQHVSCIFLPSKKKTIEHKLKLKLHVTWYHALDRTWSIIIIVHVGKITPLLSASCAFLFTQVLNAAVSE